MPSDLPFYVYDNIDGSFIVRTDAGTLRFADWFWDRAEAERWCNSYNACFKMGFIQARETPPQPDPSQLILEYVEAASDFDALVETYVRWKELEKANIRRNAAEQALFDFADSRKGE